MKVLIVEDEARLGKILVHELSGSAHVVRLVGTCAEANDALADSSYDIVILDLGLPDGDGLDLVRDWRAAGFVEPVLILSARDKRIDKVAGLDLGADDYLAKPFALDELLARMRALVRHQATRKQTIYQHNGITLDLLANLVLVDGEQIELTAREFALMSVFVQNVGRILPRSMIAEKIWEAHFDVDTNLLDVYMSRLRAKLSAKVPYPVFKTVRGIGYQMV